MEHLERLNWELSVLSRAVAYSNLSGAAGHIGLSQPQLSRIIGKLESELRVVLLDREVRRKSSWTPLAHRIAELWTRTSRNLSAEVQRIVDASALTFLRIGTLEGLSLIAMKFARDVFVKTGLRAIELDVHDLDRLEELFTRGDLDLIFTFRDPARKKYKFWRKLGYQTIDQVSVSSQENVAPVQVMSLFESSVRSGHKRNALPLGSQRLLISNSLAIRRGWIESFGGVGFLPSEVRSGRSKAFQENVVSLIAHDHFPPALWEKLSAFRA